MNSVPSHPRRAAETGPSACTAAAMRSSFSASSSSPNVGNRCLLEVVCRSAIFVCTAEAGGGQAEPGPRDACRRERAAAQAAWRRKRGGGASGAVAGRAAGRPPVQGSWRGAEAARAARAAVGALLDRRHVAVQLLHQHDPLRRHAVRARVLDAVNLVAVGGEQVLLRPEVARLRKREAARRSLVRAQTVAVLDKDMRSRAGGQRVDALAVGWLEQLRAVRSR